MRIGIFADTYKPIISGVVTAITTLENELIALGHEVFIFTLENEDAKDDKPNVIRFTGIKVPLEGLKSYRLGFLLHKKLKIVKKYNLDVIHLHTEFTMARMALMVSRKYKIPVVYTFHTLYEDYLQYISKTVDKLFHKQFLSSLASILVKPINRGAIIKTVPTRKVLGRVSNYYLNGDIRVVPTGIDLKSLEQKKVSMDKILNLKEELGINGKFIFVYIGRISAEKSIDVLLKAYQKVKTKDTVFLIIGDGPYLNELKEMTTDYNISNEEVKYLGFVPWDKIVPYYQLGDVFLNASITETQGLTYVESLACGTPLLVKKDECLDDVLIEGVNGFSFENEKELEQYMKLFISNPDKVRMLKNNTSDTISGLSKEVFGTTIEKIYKEAIENKNRSKKHFFTYRD